MFTKKFYYFLGATQTLNLPNYILGRTRFQSTEAPKETRRKYYISYFMS